MSRPHPEPIPRSDLRFRLARKRLRRGLSTTVIADELDLHPLQVHGIAEQCGMENRPAEWVRNKTDAYLAEQKRVAKMMARATGQLDELKAMQAARKKNGNDPDV